MPRTRQDPKREKRITYEIVVDAYDEWERWSGWHGYLEDKLRFPFQARCLRTRDISPLRKGDGVEVIGMVANEANDMAEMFVKIQWEDRSFGVPLQQLEGMKVDAQAREAIADWHYWCARGYQF